MESALKQNYYKINNNMNKQELAEWLFENGCALGVKQIEELLTNFLNSELAAKRPKIDLLGAGIVEPTEPEIKPEDMVSGEWYVIESSRRNLYILKFRSFKNETYYYSSMYYITFKRISETNFMGYDEKDTIRKATKEEVSKYFPNEFLTLIG